MKDKLKKLINLLGLDVLIMGLLEKMALWLTKKFSSWLEGLENLLDRIYELRNAKLCNIN